MEYGSFFTDRGYYEIPSHTRNSKKQLVARFFEDEVDVNCGVAAMEDMHTVYKVASKEDPYIIMAACFLVT